MAVTMILIAISMMVFWGPEVLQSIVKTFYPDGSIDVRFLESIFVTESGRNWAHILVYLIHHMTILNSLCDPLIIFYRMKTVRESASAMFKTTNDSFDMSESDEWSVVARN